MGGGAEKMSKYIRIDKLDEALTDMDWYHLNRYGELKQGAEGTDSALYKATDIFNAINKLERDATDVQEVVRCKDCKHSRSDEFEPLWCYVSETCDPVKGDHFCGYGERRDE